MSSPCPVLRRLVFRRLRTLIGKPDRDGVVVLKDVAELHPGGVSFLFVRKIESDPILPVINRLEEKPRLVAQLTRVDIVAGAVPIQKDLPEFRVAVVQPIRIAGVLVRIEFDHADRGRGD